MKAKQTLSRKEIRETFERNRGAAAELAKALSVSHTTLTLVLRGKTTSDRVLSAARERAVELLDAETRQKGAA